MKRGFTLIELLVVVIIIAVLAAIALPQYQKAVVKSRAAQLQTLLDAVVKEMDLYYLRHGSYRASFEKLDIGVEGETLGSWKASCGRDLVPTSTKKGKDFEISLYTGGVQNKYKVFAYFTEGKYKCRGFMHIFDQNDTRYNSVVNHHTFCAEARNLRACGDNCDDGAFCNKIMGQKMLYKNLSLTDLYN